MTPPILLLGNHKGGVGKSSTTVQLAAALARCNRRVLVIDFDPQANTTRRLGIEMDPEAPIVTVSEVVSANEVGIAAEAVVPCGWTTDQGEPTNEAKYIDVIPSRSDLINREVESGAVGAIRRLKKALAGEWIDDYDVVLIDTRPDMGHLVQMAMAAATHALIVTDAMYDGVEAAIKVSRFIDEHSEDMHNPDLKVGGVLVTLWRDTAENRFQLEGLRDFFGDQIWDIGLQRQVQRPDGSTATVIVNQIPQWARISEADGAGVSLSAWSDRKSRDPIAIYDTIAARIEREFIKEGESA